MADVMKWCTYVADDGTHYTVLVDNSYYTGTFGYLAYSALIGQLPPYIKQRYITARDATSGRSRRVTIGSTGSPYWDGTNTTVTLNNRDGTTTAYTITGKKGQKQVHIPHA